MTNIAFCVEMVNGSIDDIMEKAYYHILPILLKQAGYKHLKDALAAGYQVYRAPLQLIQREGSPYTEVVWIGIERDQNGYKLGGGLFSEEAFRAAYEIIPYSEKIGIKRVLKAEIYPIDWDRFTDLLYENLKRSKKIHGKRA